MSSVLGIKSSYKQHALKARSQCKQHALKARSQYKQHALKGQKLLAQGIALGFCGLQTMRPVRAKALKL